MSIKLFSKTLNWRDHRATAYKKPQMTFNYKLNYLKNIKDCREKCRAVTKVSSNVYYTFPIKQDKR